MTLNFADLRVANEARQKDWCPDPNQQPDLAFRALDMVGEAGEAANVAKKLERERRGWRGSRDTVEHLGRELADVVICADLTALSEGIDLGAAIVDVFNSKSVEVGLPQRLRLPSPSAVSLSVARKGLAELANALPPVWYGQKVLRNALAVIDALSGEFPA